MTRDYDALGRLSKRAASDGTFEEYSYETSAHSPSRIRTADGVTQIRTSAYDDGPKAGTVWITTVTMLGKDGVTEYAATFRAGRPAEHEVARLRIEAGRDPAHWVLVTEQDGEDEAGEVEGTAAAAGKTARLFF